MRATLDECIDSGEAVVIEMLDQRVLAIQTLEPGEGDRLVDDLLQKNSAFRAKLAKSIASQRKPFVPGGA